MSEQIQNVVPVLMLVEGGSRLYAIGDNPRADRLYAFVLRARSGEWVEWNILDTDKQHWGL